MQKVMEEIKKDKEKLIMTYHPSSNFDAVTV